ncbi:MAG TPA: hypothetical protein H9742_04125 [Candidatus Acetatifactor stercoripullorum]|uniref:Uncharacterized protein n=1 Tax=Candidatus Acetatifactor stercoripullorum TaxID=2838414 RepID=A0A9D1R602_9FIRM|nr:hypothetical protein [uncultured Acetatifactor sp.]HIW80707.1 hypothetical protein [Candidatus Acetatifactor stercoripullorum]
MKKKLPLDQEIYLPEYLSGTAAKSFEKDSDQRKLYWDFRKTLDEKRKMQVGLLLNEIVKPIKNREERRNRYLLPLKCLFCYAEKSGLKDIMKMEKAQEQEYSFMLKREYGITVQSYNNKLQVISAFLHYLQVTPLNPPKLKMFKIERKYSEDCRHSREDAFHKAVKWISEVK